MVVSKLAGTDDASRSLIEVLMRRSFGSNGAFMVDNQTTNDLAAAMSGYVCE